MIPKYDEMYRAYLQCLADGRPHYFTEVKEKVAAAMNVTREEQRQMMTNRPVSLFDNRIGWTRTYLKKAGLIDSPARGARECGRAAGQRVLAALSFFLRICRIAGARG